ncbi:MAG TPA: sugar phosphate isomerase/epimerase [Gemmatimonadaceae bacterium]|nr:sugar phosphate isomerase/epimerase [Gemmatimonadaceae bacterium]
MQNRRRFLAALGATAAGLAVGRRSGDAFTAPDAPRDSTSGRISRVGLQLYTVRRLADKDLPGTLAQVAGIGYKEVELAGLYNRSAAEVHDLLAKNGLAAPSTHVALSAIERDSTKTFADAKTLGHQWITVPSLPQMKLDTVDDWKSVAKRFNAAGAQVKAAGYRFAYHNHNAELRDLGGGTTPLDVLASETDPSLVSFEMDLYWVVNGGGDPLAFLARYPGRYKMLHVKDSVGPEHKMADVGAGQIDFKTIFSKAKGVEHYFVEHDQPADPIASIAASYKYLANLEF